jgi:hypothetical protein
VVRIELGLLSVSAGFLSYSPTLKTEAMCPNYTTATTKETEFYCTASRPILRLTQSPTHMDTSFPGVKRPGFGVNYSPLSSVEVKNAHSYTSTSPHVFNALCLIKHKDNITSLPRNRMFCFKKAACNVVPWLLLIELLINQRLLLILRDINRWTIA